MHEELDAGVASGLGLYFLVLALMNAYYAVKLLWKDKRYRLGAFWVVGSVFLLGTAAEFYRYSGALRDYSMESIRESATHVDPPHFNGLALSAGFRDAVDGFMGPVTYFAISVIAFVLMLYYRKLVSSPFFGWLMLDFSLLFIGFSMTDKDFRAIVAKPDNVPISMLIFSVGYTTWLALRQAVINDERIAAGGKPVEADGAGKVLTWPDLVYTELMSMVICTVFLLVWSICLKAPLEPPASPVKIPNPSKAPWYFLGLQEMLVYFDPWLAGVVLPTYIIIGLCALPYIDYNKKGNGYYTFVERKFAIITYMFGFLVLWVVLIVLGTFLRGPNWNFFGFYEYWSPYKVLSLNNVNLSDWIWIDVIGKSKPDFFLTRELPGILIIFGYFAIVPMMLAKTIMKPMFLRMGIARYMTMANILLMMALLPIKMVLRWSLNLKYIVYIPEYFFNI